MGKILTLLMGNIRSIIPLAVVVIVVLYYQLKINNIENRYEKQLKDKIVIIDKLNKEATVLNSKILEKDKIISSNEISINNLTTTIDKSNIEIERIKVDNKNLQAKLNNWANNPIEKEVIKYIDKIIYVKDKNNVTCKDYEDINKRISKMRYEDL